VIIRLTVYAEKQFAQHLLIEAPRMPDPEITLTNNYLLVFCFKLKKLSNMFLLTVEFSYNLSAVQWLNIYIYFFQVYRVPETATVLIG